MTNDAQAELDWKRRIPVWACDHLWGVAEAGNQEAHDAIADAAAALATDCGENVALCSECEVTEQHVVMTCRWINTSRIDGDHWALVDVGDSKDGPALATFELVTGKP